MNKIICTFLLISSIAIKSNAQSFAEKQKAFAMSINFESKGNYTEAVNQMLSFSGEKEYEYHLRLGWLYYLLQNYTKSQYHYKEAVSLKPYSIEAKLGYIKPLSVLESWDVVLQQYEEILKIDAANYSALYWSGVIQYNRKKYDSAARNLEKLINLYPFDYDANHMLAWCYLFQGKKAEAKLLFQQCLLIRPSDVSASDGLIRTN